MALILSGALHGPIRAHNVPLPIMGSHEQTLMVAESLSRVPTRILDLAAATCRGIAVTQTPILPKGDDGVSTYDGLIVLVASTPEQLHVTTLHEIGHQLALSTGAVDDKFRRAVEEDFKGMSNAVAKSLRNERDPDEAFAELFANRFADPRLYALGGRKNIRELKRSGALVDAFIRELR